MVDVLGRSGDMDSSGDAGRMGIHLVSLDELPGYGRVRTSRGRHWALMT